MKKELLIGFAAFMVGFIVGLATTQEYNAKKYEKIYTDLRRNDLQQWELEKGGGFNQVRKPLQMSWKNGN